MIPSLENTTEAQINILELQIKKKQEMFNKTTNNTRTDIKNTVQGTNNRLSETKEQISDELEGRMVEITEAEQNKEKNNKKKVRTASETFEIPLNITTLELRHLRRRKRNMKKYLRYSQKNSLTWETAIQIQEAQRLLYRINPRRNRLSTHIN